MYNSIIKRISKRRCLQMLFPQRKVLKSCSTCIFLLLWSMPNLNSGHPKLSLEQAAQQVNLTNTSNDKCCGFEGCLLNCPRLIASFTASTTIEICQTKKKKKRLWDIYIYSSSFLIHFNLFKQEIKYNLTLSPLLKTLAEHGL